ncbi:MAG: carbohydrate ABC transporter permease [Anaerolineales bacterium]|nr:carbohydrate ABC transporter permease [Anaerolineales bacterium]
MGQTELTNSTPGPTLSTGSRRLGRLSFKARDLPVYLILLVFLLIAIFPFIIMVFTAFKTSSELARGAFSLPEVWRWSNFADAWTQARFDRFFFSSVIVAIPVVLVSTALSVMSGYAFGRMTFPFSRALFFILLLGIMVPLEALIIPLYHNLRWIGLLDTYWALILPQIGMSVSFGTFWMRGFFAEVPQDLVDAATVDGCNSWDTLWRVLLPTAMPAITSMMVLFFVWTWNDFLLALVLISTESLRTLPLGLAFFQGQHTTNVPLVAAGATIVAIPAIMMYVAFQRQFIRGITGGSIEG